MTRFQITANGGFFLTNMLSFLNPTPLALQTPPELQAYGWTTTDLWCAPMITGLYALLTHAQPFWAETHVMISQVLGSTPGGGKEVEALDPELARAVCAIILSGLFVTRTVKNFGGLKSIFPIEDKRDTSVHSKSQFNFIFAGPESYMFLQKGRARHNRLSLYLMLVHAHTRIATIYDLIYDSYLHDFHGTDGFLLALVTVFTCALL